MKQYVYDDSTLLSLCNDIRELVINDLTQQDYITSEQRTYYLKTRVLIGYRPSWLGRIWNVLNQKMLNQKNTEGDTFTIIPISIQTDDENESQPNKKLHLIKTD